MAIHISCETLLGNRDRSLKEVRLKGNTEGECEGGTRELLLELRGIEGVNRERACARDADSDPMISTGDVFMCVGDGKLMRS